jgi:hypothetical protein
MAIKSSKNMGSGNCNQFQQYRTVPTDMLPPTRGRQGLRLEIEGSLPVLWIQIRIIW